MIANPEIHYRDVKKLIHKLATRTNLVGFVFSKWKNRRKKLILSVLKMETFSWFLDLPKTFHRNLYRFYVLALKGEEHLLGKLHSSLSRAISKSLGPRQRLSGWIP